EFRKPAELSIEATNWALSNIAEERVRYHTCWGSWHTPHTTDIPFKHIVDLMLKVKAQAYSVEAADVRHELDYQVWEDVKFPDGKIYIPGVIAHKTTTIEPPELVAHRIVRYANIMGRENVIAGTDVARRRAKNAATSGGTDVKWTAKPWEPSGMGPMTLA